MIVPPFIVAIIMFFAAGTNETVKVIMGTIYLLLYVLGIVAYFVLNILFGGTSVETVLNSDLDTSSSVYALYRDNFKKLTEVTSESNTISPDGQYQIILYDVKDSDKGAVKICVVPYNQISSLNSLLLSRKVSKRPFPTRV